MEVMQLKMYFFLRQMPFMDERSRGRGWQYGESLVRMADSGAFARKVHFHIHRNHDALRFLRLDVGKFYLEKVPVLFGVILPFKDIFLMFLIVEIKGEPGGGGFRGLPLLVYEEELCKLEP